MAECLPFFSNKKQMPESYQSQKLERQPRLESPLAPEGTAARRSIAFLARKLDRGGAERQLVTLAIGLHSRGWDVAVILFYRGGDFDEKLREAGIPLYYLEKRGRWDVWRFFWNLTATVTKTKPAILYSFLDVPNLLSVLFSTRFSKIALVWGIRAAYMDLSRYDWLTRNASRVESLLSRIPDVIIANSCAGKSWAIKRGFPPAKLTVIQNGIDTEFFCHDPDGRLRVRTEWGLGNAELTVGVIGRLDPMKGHEVFLMALPSILERHPNLKIVFVGGGSAAYRRRLEILAAGLNLSDKLLWAGLRAGMPEIYSALDVVCSPSVFGEGFPNAVAEAMACGVPCLVTDVGDSAQIVGGSGEVVAPGNPHALANGMSRLLERIQKERPQMMAATRSRISNEYTVAQLIERTVRAFESLR